MKLILLVLLPLIASCWWDVGHMLTAAIAQIQLNQLDPRIAANFKNLVNSINDLVDNRSRSFVESACWPDDIKSKTYNMDLWNELHFIDTPYVTDATIPIINYTQIAMNSVNTVETARTVLKHNIDSNRAERALFARYLVHLVGDIHQPLHSVALYNNTYKQGDMGGNLLKVKLPSGETVNFHSFWDAGAFLIQNDSWVIQRPMNLQNSTELRRVAQGLINQYGAKVTENAKIIDPSIWAKESLFYAQNTTYPKLQTTNQLDNDYINLSYETCKERITLAGYRLANFVLDVYQNPTINPERNRQKIQEDLMQGVKADIQLE